MSMPNKQITVKSSEDLPSTLGRTSSISFGLRTCSHNVTNYGRFHISKSGAIPLNLTVISFNNLNSTTPKVLGQELDN
jgi:hypothetical protein